MMEYRDSAGAAEYDDKAGIFQGQAITFEGKSLRETESAFRDSAGTV